MLRRGTIGSKAEQLASAGQYSIATAVTFRVRTGRSHTSKPTCIIHRDMSRSQKWILAEPVHPKGEDIARMSLSQANNCSAIDRIDQSSETTHIPSASYACTNCTPAESSGALPAGLWVSSSLSTTSGGQVASIGTMTSDLSKSGGRCKCSEPGQHGRIKYLELPRGKPPGDRLLTHPATPSLSEWLLDVAADHPRLGNFARGMCVPRSFRLYRGVDEGGSDRPALATGLREVLSVILDCMDVHSGSPA